MSERKQYYEILSLLQQKKIPEAFPSADENHQLREESLQIRSQLLSVCGYCLLAYEWLKPLAKWIGDRRCLEIMCGSGALSYGLQHCGVDIRATDDFSWDREHSTAWFRNGWTNLEELSAIDAIEKYGREITFLICSWPFLSEDCYHALQKMREVNPASRMIFIGEWRGGTASDNFFDAAEIVEDITFTKAISNFKRIYGVCDWPYLIK